MCWLVERDRCVVLREGIEEFCEGAAVAARIMQAQHDLTVTE